VEGSSVPPEWERLARLQQTLRSLEGGGDPAASEAGAERGVRLRVARRALEQVIRRDEEARARRLHEEFERAVVGVAARAASWARAVSPPDIAGRTAPVAPAVPLPRKNARKAASAVAAPTQTTMPGAPRPSRAKAPAKPRRARRPRSPAAPLPEFWSPTAVLGFRMWDLRGKLHGAWRAWQSPVYEARCLAGQTDGDDDVPHTDGRCGPPPCGLYCFKEPEQLLAAFGLPGGSNRIVAGLVALSGKVVEHERGYRAKQARVVAAAVVGRGRMVRVEDAARLRRLFADPEQTVDYLSWSDPGLVEEFDDRRAMAAAVAAYLGLVRSLCLAEGR